MNLFEQLPLFRSAPAPDVTGGERQRYLQLGTRVVAYRLHQGKRRRLAMTIDERGLSVGAPLRMAIREIETFIASHSAWVAKKLDEYVAGHAHRHLRVRDGAVLPILGGEAGVRIVAGANRVSWDDGTLVIKARPDADCEALARRALQRHAVGVFAERIAHYAERLGRNPPALRLSSARTRWGSCSEKSGVSLNWRLIHLPLALIDYVVAHELAHLVEMNHSPRFWAVVERLCPDWRELRRQLKDSAAKMPIL